MKIIERKGRCCVAHVYFTRLLAPKEVARYAQNIGHINRYTPYTVSSDDHKSIIGLGVHCTVYTRYFTLGCRIFVRIYTRCYRECFSNAIDGLPNCGVIDREIRCAVGKIVLGKCICRLTVCFSDRVVIMPPFSRWSRLKNACTPARFLWVSSYISEEKTRPDRPQ